ncbi:MAG: hypothetical protein ABIF19_16915 [Planctomycetota bacterium]
MFLRQGRFDESGVDAKVERVEIHDAVGAGKGIQLTFPSGYTYTIALYENTPFVCIKSSMHNHTDKPLIIDAVSPVRFTVDLDKPAGDLRILGCDGLTTAEADRVSYTFLAIAKPDALNGVVCGWLTHDRASGIVSSKQNGDLVAVEPRSEYGKLLVPYAYAAVEQKWPGHRKELETVVMNTAKKTGAFVVGTNLVGAITHGPWRGRIYGGNSVAAGRTGRTVAAAKDRDRDIMLVRL